MSLVEKILKKIPDCIKVMIFELTEYEELFLEISREAERKFLSSTYLTRGYDIKECEKIKEKLESILKNKKERIRFNEYFLKKINSLDYKIHLLRGYH